LLNSGVVSPPFEDEASVLATAAIPPTIHAATWARDFLDLNKDFVKCRKDFQLIQFDR